MAIVAMRSAVVFACALAFANAASGVAARAQTASGAIYASETATSTQQDIRNIISSDSSGDAFNGRLLAFYQARDFKPVWTGSNGAWGRQQALRSVLENADQQGLRSDDYTAAFSQWSAAPQTGTDAAEYDLVMTDALLRYARDVRTGRVNPNGVYKDVGLPVQKFDAVAAFEIALKQDTFNAFLAALPPPDPAYRGLVAGLARYRAIEAQGGWPIVPGKTAIALDGSDPRAAVLMKRLAFEDETLAAAAEPSMVDLREAVLRYQRRNGFPDDGKVGPAMLKELNIPVSVRIAQIVANMERWRWMPRQFERRYILVNVPDQSVDFIRDGAVALHSRVVIGRKDNPTPILRTMVIAVVANPPWDIPDDIVAKNILPQLRRSPDYLASRNMVLADGPPDDPQGETVNWASVSATDIPYQFQQNPGSDNALGALMLDMPNPFNVYLHDTPNKELFLSDMREKSHGCVRVQQIFPLASLALTDGTKDGAQQLVQAVATGQTQRLPLAEPLPVYMVYWTAIPQPDSTIGFRPDLYDRDPPLIESLTQRASEAANPPPESPPNQS